MSYFLILIFPTESSTFRFVKEELNEGLTCGTHISCVARSWSRACFFFFLSIFVLELSRHKIIETERHLSFIRHLNCIWSTFFFLSKFIFCLFFVWFYFFFSEKTTNIILSNIILSNYDSITLDCIALDCIAFPSVIKYFGKTYIKCLAFCGFDFESKNDQWSSVLSMGMAYIQWWWEWEEIIGGMLYGRDMECRLKGLTFQGWLEWGRVHCAC